MTRSKLERICMAHGISVRSQRTTGTTKGNSQKQYLYLFKWGKAPGRPRGVTRSVYLCPESELGKVAEDELQTKIAQLLAKLVDVADAADEQDDASAAQPPDADS